MRQRDAFKTPFVKHRAIVFALHAKQTNCAGCFCAVFHFRIFKKLTQSQVTDVIWVAGLAIGQ